MASRFERLLLTSVLAVVRRPRLTLGVAAAVLVACVVLAKARLPMSADQNKLFSADVPFFKDYLRFVELFPENEAIYLILEARDPAAPPPPITRWTAAAEAVAARLRQLPHAVKSVDQRVPIDALGDQGLLFDDAEGVRQTIEQARPFVPLVKLWAEESNLATRLLGRVPIDRFLGALALRASDAEAGAFVARLAESWNKTLSNPPPAASQAGDSRSATPQAADVVVPDLESLDPPTSPGRLGYYWVADETDPARQRHLLLVRVYPNVDYRDPNSLSDAFDAIRGAARDEVAKFPEFTIGASGRPALEAEEMRTTDRDATRSEILALSLVFVGLVVTLRSLWLAAVAEVALAVAIGWTFGWAAVSVGELNLLSMVFLIALIGIGMDYLVQILTRYVQELARHGRDRAEGIWLRVFKHVGPPINTACAGAAGAFLVSALTDFKGAADLGVIAGGGLLLCLVSGYTVLPALLTVFPPTRLINAMMEDGSRRRNLSLGEDPDRTWDGAPDPGLRQGSGAGVLSASVRGRRSLALPLVWGALLVVATPFMFRARFDPGLLELQAQNLESVQLVRKLSTWSAVVLSTDLDTLRAARAALAEADTVAGTDSILNAHDNAAWLAAGPNRLPDIDWSAPAAVAAGDVPRIANKARVLAGRFAAGSEAARALATFSDRLAAADPALAAAQLSRWQSAFVAELRRTIAKVTPAGVDVDRLPHELLSHYAGRTDPRQPLTYALYVYPKQDLWQRPHLEAFVRQIEQRTAPVVAGSDAVVTGIAHNIYHSTASVAGAFYEATLYALALIVLLVWLDLRSVGQTLVAISVLGLGLPMLIGLMGLFGVSWNFANFFGLPILIGAGHEYGVFMVHRYREARKDPRRAWAGWDVSDRALLLCAYVTCTAFGFFWLLAHHQGLRSLGLVMFAGTACIYLATITVVRPILKWRLGRNAER